MSPNGKNIWDQLRSDLSNRYLTQKGYEVGLKKLLISEKFLIDENEILKSAQFKAAKKASEENLEYETEIAELKAGIQKLRSDLATCFSQYTDVGDPVDFV